jgi:trigger factor
VNVSVENLAPCKKLVRVELEAQAVEAEYEKVTTTFLRQASLPGFRPGKVPRDLVAKTFTKEIDEEVKKRVIGDSYRKAINDQKLHVVGYPDIEEIQFGRGQALQFAATIETAPEFEMPDYKGLTVRVAPSVVTEDDMERAMKVLRDERATYTNLERPVENGDFVVVNYTGTSEGKPILEVAPTAKGLTDQKNFWLHVEAGSFIPGFTEQLVGAKAGERRSVAITFPADFVETALASKPGTFDVEVLQVKERRLPEIDEAFAKSYGAPSLDKFREGVRQDLQNELNYKQRTNIRNQLVSSLLARIACDLPESVVQAETRNVVYDLVRQNQERGVSKEVMNEKKRDLFLCQQ